MRKIMRVNHERLKSVAIRKTVVIGVLIQVVSLRYFGSSQFPP